MGIVESIKKGFSVAVSSLPVVSVLFVFGFIFNMINLTLSANAVPNAPPSPAMIATAVVFILVTVFMQSGSMGYARDKIKTGTANFSNFLSDGSKYYARILLLSIVIAAIIGAFVLVAALIVALLGQTMQMVAMGLAIVIAAVGIYFLILLFLAPYISIADEKGVVVSLKESVRTVRANLLAVVGLSLILIAIGFLIGLTIGLVIGLLSHTLPANISQILFALLSSLVNSFLGFFVTASFMGFYLRVSSQPSSGAASH